jgi:hypothetical protein
MSEYAIIFQVLGAALALFVIFLTYMSTKTWRWVHVTFMFLVFVASFVFSIYAAMVLKTRATWIKQHDTLEAQLAKASDDVERTTRGDPKDFEGKTESLIGLREEIARITLDRGRVWRGCTVTGVNRQALAETPPRVIVSLQTSPSPDPSNPAAAKKNNLQPKTILHVFREGQTNEGGPIVPLAYIGEFKVAAQPAPTDATVTLEATMPLSPEQLQSANVPGTWVLYETAPVDGHEWFTGPPEERTKPMQIAAQASAERIPPEVANRIIEAYTRDGEDAKETDPPENVWYKVIFDQEYEVTVDAPIVNSIDTDPFNTEGQAVLRRLRRGGATPEDSGKVTFGPKEGQINWAVLDRETAQSLVDRMIAKFDPEAKPIYRRKLVDYERRFHAINDRTTEINDRIRQLDLDNKAMIAATQKAEQQRAQVEELKGKVTADLAKVKYELAELEKYLTTLNSRLAAVQTDLSQLYQSNRVISQELNELTARLTDEINQRTRQATASSR